MSNMRSNKSLFAIGPFTNRNLNLAALGSLALVLAVALIPPVRTAFSLISLPMNLWAAAIGLVLVPLPVMELGKIILRKIKP